MTLPRIVGGVTVKLRTFTLTMLTALTCGGTPAAVIDGASATGITSFGPSACVVHPATLADVSLHSVELAVLPGPYGLWDLTVADAYAAVGDSLYPTIVGLRGMAGRLWYELRGTIGRSWAIADGADIGLAASAGIDGGSDLERRWWLVLTGGFRWQVDTVWTIGVTLTDAMTLGRDPSQDRRLTIGVGMHCGNGIDVAVDTSVDPLAGFGLLLGARMDVHPRLAVRCSIRSYPLRFTTGLRCDVASRTSVCIDVDLVRELGSRTRMGVVWQL